jgi:ParB family transcriptional regulator, chromosome partitioning protein
MSMWDNTTFELIDPRELLLDNNARTIVDIQSEAPDLVASVKLHGVMVPLIANPAEDGRRRIREGHSRALAAILAVDEHPVVPVLVTECTDDRVWIRLRDQWVANEVRRGFSPADKARIVEQMALEGLSDEDIAAQLTVSTDVVRAGRRVHASQRATAALEQHPQLTLMQVTTYAEFEDDPEACETLDETLDEEPEQFDHVASQLRLTREAKAARDQVTAELRADGMTVLDDDQAREALSLDRLYRDATTDVRLSRNSKAHVSCPGHSARVVRGYGGAAPRVELMCHRWAEHGHRDSLASSGTRPRTGQRTEAEKQDMRRVRVNNELWRAALPVRRKFVRDLLARKTPPKRAVQHLLAALAEGRVSLTRALSQDGNRFACTLLGLKGPKHGQRHPIAAKAKRATADQALIMNIGIVLAAFELAYDLKDKVNTWRCPTDDDKLYFAMLKDWGYTLSKVERLILDPEADVKDWPHLQAGNEAPVTDSADDLDNGDEFDELADQLEPDDEAGDRIEDEPGFADVDASAAEDTMIAA